MRYCLACTLGVVNALDKKAFLLKWGLGGGWGGWWLWLGIFQHFGGLLNYWRAVAPAKLQLMRRLKHASSVVVCPSFHASSCCCVCHSSSCARVRGARVVS